MNINPVIAILILKKIITEEEGQAVVDFVHDKPQSTILSDVINQIKELLPMNQPAPLTGGPVQQAEELAARDRLAAETKAAEEAEAKKAEEAVDESTASDEDKGEDSKPPKK